MIIRKVAALRGSVKLPGDKSISHRALMLAAIAEGSTRIRNLSESADVASTAQVLTSLGVAISKESQEVIVKGCAGRLTAPQQPLDCGNSGTTMRLMSGLLAWQPFGSKLIGDVSLSKRPMRRVIEPLRLMGAGIDSADDHPPLTIHGKQQLQSIDYRTPIDSAQVKSCVLLAGLGAVGITAVTESSLTRNHTERMLRWFGVELEEAHNGLAHRIGINGPAKLIARDLTIPSDTSAATFFLVAAACIPGSELVLRNVGLNPSRVGIIEFLRSVGADISIGDKRLECNEELADIVIRGGLGDTSKRHRLDGEKIAGLIDEIPALAVLGTRLQGGLEIRDAGELRFKESDRIRSVVSNLRKMGASVEEHEDGMTIEQSTLHGAQIESFDDHRIAMAFTVAGLIADGTTEIVGAECAAVSFPSFFSELSNVTVN